MLKMEDKTDEELVELVLNNKTEAFGVLAERYEKKLIRYGKKFLYNYENIEDAVQNIFIKSYVNIKGFDIRKKFSPWIYRIAHNEFINIIKKKKKEPLLFLDADIIFSFSKKDNLLNDIKKGEEKKEIEGHLNELKIKYREPIVLYYFEEKSYQEISDILEIPVSTVGTRLKRGLNQIKKSLYEKRK
jgi:RNA polymerase sigma-70 factor (ECF subfamily)